MSNEREKSLKVLDLVEVKIVGDSNKLILVTDVFKHSPTYKGDKLFTGIDNEGILHRDFLFSQIVEIKTHIDLNNI